MSGMPSQFKAVNVLLGVCEGHDGREEETWVVPFCHRQVKRRKELSNKIGS